MSSDADCLFHLGKAKDPLLNPGLDCGVCVHVSAAINLHCSATDQEEHMRSFLVICYGSGKAMTAWLWLVDGKDSYTDDYRPPRSKDTRHCLREKCVYVFLSRQIVSKRLGIISGFYKNVC